jgi:phage tail-like protein
MAAVPVTPGNYIPPVGFFYTLSFLSMGGAASNDWDAGFQEVSGISAKMETDTITMGGENRFAYKVPKRVTYSDLVLKRGLIIPSSPIANWCFDHLKGGLNTKIEPKTITVTLLDANVDHHKPIMTWVFVNAYPIGWDVEGLNAQQNGLAIESLTLSYNYFWKLDEDEGKKYPFQAE